MDFEMEEKPATPSASDAMKAKLLDELIEKIMLSEEASPEGHEQAAEMPVEKSEEEKLAALKEL